MQRKLVDYSVFEKLQEKSLNSTEYELIEAENILGTVLDVGPLAFHSFNESTVMYETADGNYVRANYSLRDKNAITFDNIEEIVIDEGTQKRAIRSQLSEMVDAILEDNTAKADALFNNVVGIFREQHKREAAELRQAKINEGTVNARKRPNRFIKGKGWRKGKGISAVNKGSADSKARSKRAKEWWAKHPGAAKKRWKSRRTHDTGLTQQSTRRRTSGHAARRSAAFRAGRVAKKHMNEWLSLTENVWGYIDFVENGHVANEANVQHNNKGDVVTVQVPTTKSRNEGKILQANWKILKTDIKIMRENARRLSADRAFCESLADLKRHNNLSDNKSLEECLDKIASKWPSLLYLTQTELSNVIGEALSNLGVGNFDDTTCEFMAEGILRVAHHMFSDRVNRIGQLAQAPVSEGQDKYATFQRVVHEFYPKLDEATALEMRVFEDLYNAALDVRRVALEAQDDALREEAQEHAVALHNVLSGQEVPSLELAALVAEWLEELMEANLEGASDGWDIVKVPYQTTAGEHPKMAQLATQPGHPGSYKGDWGDSLPAIGQDSHDYSSGKHADEMRNRSWGNKGGKGVWPDLTNPYVPEPFGDYTMKGEKGVDKDWESGEAMWQSKETWPNLQNPYVPQAVRVHVNSDNRVDDKVNPIEAGGQAPTTADNFTLKYSK